MTLIVGSLVLPDRVVEGWLLVRDGTIVDIGLDGPPPPEADQVDAPLVLPGLVDMHCHGGGGGGFDGGFDQAGVAARFHAAHGTTTVMASLGSTSHRELLGQVRALGPAVADGTLFGLHLEGPYLSPARRGAHPEGYLRPPDRTELAEVLDAAGGSIAMVTLAPELPGALAAIAALRAVGVVVALGHTDASYPQAVAGIDAGATVATHLFNGMRPIHHRDGGPVIALVGDDRVACELIADGHHVSPEMCLLAYRLAGPDRLVLITDAIPAAGRPDGDYLVGTEAVRVTAGEVRTADGRSLAGSGLTLMAAVRFAVACGIPTLHAVRAASGNPARAIGAHDRGRLAAGLRADLVLTDGDLRVRRVMRAGHWL